MVRKSFCSLKCCFCIISFLVPLNSTVILSSVNWVPPPPELQEGVVGDLSESNLDKTFNLGKETNELEIMLTIVFSRNSSKSPPVSRDQAGAREAEKCDCCQGEDPPGSSGEEASGSSEAK